MLISRRGFVQGAAAVPFLSVQGRAQRAAGVLRYGLSAWPPNLQPWVSDRRLGRHGEDADPPPPGRLRQRGQAASASWPKAWSRDERRRLGVQAALRTPCSTTASRSPPTTSNGTIEQIAGEKSTAYMRAPVPEHRAHRDARSAHHPPRHQGAGRRRCRPGSPTTTCSILSAKSTANEPIGCGPFRLDRPGARHLDRARRLRQVLQARPAASSRASASSSMRTRTCASPRCSPATST